MAICVFLIFVYNIIDKYINLNIISFKICININNNSIYYVYYINYTMYNFKKYNNINNNLNYINFNTILSCNISYNNINNIIDYII